MMDGAGDKCGHRASLSFGVLRPRWDFPQRWMPGSSSVQPLLPGARRRIDIPNLEQLRSRTFDACPELGHPNPRPAHAEGGRRGFPDLGQGGKAVGEAEAACAPSLLTEHSGVCERIGV